MILVYTRAADGSVIKPDGTPGRYQTADMIEAEALYLGLCAARTEEPTEARITYPAGTDLPNGRFRLDRDNPGPREADLLRRAWGYAATDPAAPPNWLIKAALRYAKTERGLIVRQVAALIAQEERAIRSYTSEPETNNHRKIAIGIWWLLLIRLGLVPPAEI